MPKLFNRGLSEKAMKELQNQEYLKPIIQAVKEHNNDANNKNKISFNIRPKNQAHLYYHGGVLGILDFYSKPKDRITAWLYNSRYYERYNKKGGEKLSTEAEQLATNMQENKELILKNIEAINKLLSEWEYMIEIMNKAKLEENNEQERQFQQNLEFHNNQDLKNNFFIIDTEYALGNKPTGKNANFDMIAIEKIDNKYQLVLVENKVGKGSLAENKKEIGDGSGIADHLKHMYDLVKIKEHFFKFKENIELIANQLIRLGLIECQQEEIKLDMNLAKAKVLFIIADYNESSGTISKELDKFKNSIEENKPLDINFLFLEKDEFIYDKNNLLNVATVIEKQY